MRQEWIDKRYEILFENADIDLAVKCDRVLDGYSNEYLRASEKRREEIIWIIKSLAIDLGSALIRWPARIDDKTAADEILKISELLCEYGKDSVAEDIRKEIEAIRASNLVKLIYDKKLNNFWGNDNATGLAEAMRKGAVFATTNPPILNIERKRDPKMWNSIKSGLKAENSSLEPYKLVWITAAQMVLKNCIEIRPIYEASDGKLGFVCYQVDPQNIDDAKKMVKEAVYVYEYMRNSLKKEPNVSFKLPGTEAGIIAAEALTKKGLSVTITLCFSVPQHIVFAKAIEMGDSPSSFIVMMSGRLDDPIRQELEKAGLKEASMLSRYASEAVIKRSYKEIYDKRKSEKSAMLVASLRGPWNIEAALCDGAVPVYISSFPDKTDEFDANPKELVSNMHDDIPSDIIEQLCNSSIFRKAYGIDEMRVDGFDEFYPVKVTANAFVEAYKDFCEWVVNDSE